MGRILLAGTLTIVGASNDLVRQLLAWIDERPRTYAETMDAWRTSCPRLSIWEDAIDEGLLRREGENVVLTEAGMHALNVPTKESKTR